VALCRMGLWRRDTSYSTTVTSVREGHGVLQMSSTFSHHTGGKTAVMYAQVAQRGNLRRSARVRALYHDVRRSCGLFDNAHLRATAPQPGEMCVPAAEATVICLGLCETSHTGLALRWPAVKPTVMFSTNACLVHQV